MTKAADPGPKPGPDASPKDREKWRQANERFLCEGFKKGASKLPANVNATDKRLQELRKDARKFLDVTSPAKASIWLALLRDSKDVLFDDEMSNRYQRALALGSSDESHFVAPDRPAIVDLGIKVVAQMLRGDPAALGQIMDRIEGKAGLRLGDVEGESPEKQKREQDITERVIRAMTKTRLPAKEEIIDVTATEVAPPSEDA